MYKYIITWILVQVNSVPCEQPNDKFGRESNTFLAVNCMEVDEAEKSKTFKTRASAFVFYNEAKEESIEGDLFFTNNELTNVKIDSVLINNLPQ